MASGRRNRAPASGVLELYGSSAAGAGSANGRMVVAVVSIVITRKPCEAIGGRATGCSTDRRESQARCDDAEAPLAWLASGVVDSAPTEGGGHGRENRTPWCLTTRRRPREVSMLDWVGVGGPLEGIARLSVPRLMPRRSWRGFGPGGSRPEPGRGGRVACRWCSQVGWGGSRARSATPCASGPPPPTMTSERACVSTS